MKVARFRLPYEIYRFPDVARAVLRDVIVLGAIPRICDGCIEYSGIHEDFYDVILGGEAPYVPVLMSGDKFIGWNADIHLQKFSVSIWDWLNTKTAPPSLVNLIPFTPEPETIYNAVLRPRHIDGVKLRPSIENRIGAVHQVIRGFKIKTGIYAGEYAMIVLDPIIPDVPVWFSHGDMAEYKKIEEAAPHHVKG